VIFLDEPTAGLDPVSRMGMWEIVQNLVEDGSTVLLTTQYLDEADRLADSITVLSSGRVVASGSTAELKAAVGKRTVTASLADAASADLALDALRRAGLQPVTEPGGLRITTPVDRSTELAVVVRALDEVSIEPTELALGEPTLDDVYLTLAHSPSTHAA
jgi:ABC-2 type transport system ATP-binding protein